MNKFANVRIIRKPTYAVLEIKRSRGKKPYGIYDVTNRMKRGALALKLWKEKI